MDKNVYHDMAKQQEEHWWFKARRKVIRKILSKCFLTKKSKILEVGCGTGGNLLMLNNYGKVFAMEMDKFAVEYAKHGTGIDVKEGWIPDNIPFNESFDLICMFDVLEHVQNDQKALLELTKSLNPRGILVITVPAHSWLYGTHDELLHHYRRYSLKSLRELIGCTGLNVVSGSYFNTFLFPLIILARLFDKLKLSKCPVGYSTPNNIINQLFYRIFSIESLLIDKINFPFGSSIILVCKNT